MDRPPRENPNLPRPIPRPDAQPFPQPEPRGHRRQHRLHEVNRRHGAVRYEPYAHDLQIRRAGRHRQYYQWHWETENNRWIWLRPNWQNLTRARCLVCHREFGADIGTVRTHENSRRHRDRMMEINVPMDDVYEHHLNHDEFKDEEARIKLILTVYFGEEGIAFEKIDTLLPVIKNISRHPGVLQQLKLTRWDLSKINSKIIGPVFKQQLAETLTRNKFSILFDESTGVSKDKHGCLLVRFSDHRSYKIRTVIWDFIPIYRDDQEHSDETAESLYYLISNSLFGRQLAVEQNRAALPRENLVSSGTDGCNSMVGVNNSVATRLRANFPGINHVTCPCHNCHLTFSHSIEECCPIIIEILIDLYNWFCSSKRLYALKQNQIRLNMEVHKLLRFVTSRWLTGLPAIIRIDEQIPAIEATLIEDPTNQKALDLLMLIRSPIIRCLIPFFIFIWEVIEDLNGWLQTEEVIIPEVFPRMIDDFKDILLCYMDAEYIENANLLQINTEDAEHFLPHDDMLIGNDARQLAQELPANLYPYLMRVIREYLIRLAYEWLERLVLPWSRYQCLESLLRENAFSEEYHLANPEVLHDLVTLFPRAVPPGVDEDLLQEQWNDLLMLDHLNLPIPPDVKTDYLWFTLYDMMDEERRHPFRELAEFVLNIMTTPHSNAEPERCWSTEKYVHNKYRNRLATESTRAILQVKSLMKMNGCAKQVYKFSPPPEMIRRVRYRLYDVEQQEVLENLIDSESDTDDDEDENDNAGNIIE